ncbi:hypothetical protein BC937DRAFT_88321 [Endogone sp. FLAS-F59071]|nr:hypothetical protein BC937DRAFT_88321 [Endogone sp. FLAS-F59071]|eukprot:RUS18800.1 hypothetical protein BC937DRAFT_88321 [Endogone sp. FLAS-F59071]
MSGFQNSTCLVTRVPTASNNLIEVLNLPKGNWSRVATHTLNFDENSGESFYGTLSNIIATISKSDNDVTQEISPLEDQVVMHEHPPTPNNLTSFDDCHLIDGLELTYSDLLVLDDFLAFDFLGLDHFIFMVTPPWENVVRPVGKILPDQENSIGTLGRPNLENWYNHFGKRSTLLATILDPTGEPFDESWRAYGNPERARL